jgi:hypothetical protein
MYTYALGSAVNDGAWQAAAAAAGLPLVAGYAASVRSCNQTLDKTLDAPVSTVSSASLSPRPKNSVGPRPASRVLLSSVLFQIA